MEHPIVLLVVGEASADLVTLISGYEPTFRIEDVEVYGGGPPSVWTPAAGRPPEITNSGTILACRPCHA